MSKLRDSYFLEGRIPEFKICSQCNINKDYKNYHLRVYEKNIQLRSECKDCSLKYARKSFAKLTPEQKEKRRETLRNWKNKNPTRYKENAIFKRYKINFDDLNNLLVAQDYRCFICKISQKELGKYLSIDHCHTTGKVRGLLCNSCNNGLGRFKDNITYLKNAIKYLENGPNSNHP